MATMNLKQIDEMLMDLCEKKTAAVETKRVQMEREANEYRRAMASVNKIIPTLIESLSKLGLEVGSFSVVKTGVSNDETWSEGTMLKVAIQATPNGSKFRFIKFNGYDKRGAGKNQAALVAKASKIEHELGQPLGDSIVSISVNQFSLEQKDDGKTNRVLIDLWVK